MARDDFSKSTIEALAKRVGCFCSNPDCGRATVGPHTDPTTWVNIGVAANIIAASPGGPRSDSTTSPEVRKEITNGIWLCQTCSKLIDDDPLKYPSKVLRKWKADKETEAEKLLTHGAVPDVNGLPLVVSEPLRLGMRAHVRLADNSNMPLAYISSKDDDPTFYAAAFVFRLLVRPVQSIQATFIQAIGIDVLAVEPIPPSRPLMGVYPTRYSIFLLPFGDPKIAGENRFLSEKYYCITGGRSEGSPYQPVGLDLNLPEIIDCRLAPRDPGLFTLRVFAIVSVGTTIKEQELIGPTKVLVPEPSKMLE